MSEVTRIGDHTSGRCDMGYDCCSHDRTGINGDGSHNVIVNGIGAHRLGDGGGIICPHGGYFRSNVASATVFVNGRGITRRGDATSCIYCGQPGHHCEGSPNVYAG